MLLYDISSLRVNDLTHVRFEVHTTVNVKAAVFLDVILPLGQWDGASTPTFQLRIALK